MKTFKSWWDKEKREGIWDYEEYYEAGWIAASEEFKTLEEENKRLEERIKKLEKALRQARQYYRKNKPIAMFSVIEQALK